MKKVGGLFAKPAMFRESEAKRSGRCCETELNITLRSSGFNLFAKYGFGERTAILALLHGVLF